MCYVGSGSRHAGESALVTEIGPKMARVRENLDKGYMVLYRCVRITVCLKLSLVKNARCMEQEDVWLYWNEVIPCGVRVLMRHVWLCSLDQVNCILNKSK